MKDSRQVVLLNLDDILPNRFQPRIKFDEKAIIELSESIKEHGVIQPIIVRKISDKFEIIAGERRYKASVMAGKSNIPAIIVDLNDKDSSEIALIENVQRQDLTPIEEAISYRKILDMGYLTQEALAVKLGVAQSTIANKLRLLNLDDEVQEALLDGKISERHARSLLKLQKTSMQREMLKKIINERLTVRKTDEVINDMMKNNQTSILDSIENNEFTAFNSDNQVENNKLDNPFIINNQVEQPVTNSNVEVLDFGFEEINPDKEAQVLNNEIESIEEENNNIPTAPIVEDTEVSVSDNINNFPELNQNPISDNIENSNEDSTSVVEEPVNNNITNIGDLTNDEIPRPVGRFFTMIPPTYEEDNQESSEMDLPKQNSDIPVDNPEPNIFGAQVETPSFTPEVQNISSPENIDIPSENVFSPENTSAPSENIFNAQPIFSEPSTPVSIPDVPTEQPVVETYEADVIPAPIENINLNISQQPIAVEQNNKLSLRDIINKMRKCADEIEASGFDIDTEEFDFDDIYQVIFKIKK